MQLMWIRGSHPVFEGPDLVHLTIWPKLSSVLMYPVLGRTWHQREVMLTYEILIMSSGISGIQNLCHSYPETCASGRSVPRF